MKQFLHKLLLAVLFFSAHLSQGASAQTTVTIGSGTSTYQYHPINALADYNYTQTIYTKAEIEAGGGSAGTITKIRWKPNLTQSTETFKGWVVYLANTSKGNFTSVSDWVPLASLTEVFSGQIQLNSTTAGEWMELSLTTPFAWDGTSNLVVAIDENTPGRLSSGTWAAYTPSPVVSHKSMYYYSNSTNPNPASPVNGTRVNTVAQIQFVIGDACTDVSTATLTSSDNAICTGNAFYLHANPSGLGDLSYQFQYSDNGTDWNNLGTPVLSSVYTIPAQTATTQYRVQVSCAGGTAVTSAPVTVTQNTFIDCYCTPTIAGGGTVRYIANFATSGGITNINQTSTGSATGYTDHTATASASAYQGATIDFTITPNGSSTHGYAVYLDYNMNGMFETSERVANSTSAVASPISGSFTIPLDATPGTMRLRTVASTLTNPNDPCSLTGSGEFEDYLFTIVELPVCSGAPLAMLNSSAGSICKDSVLVLTATPSHLDMTGLSFQFQSSVNGTDWNDLGAPSATNTYTLSSQTVATQYRVLITCSGQTGTSAPITVNQNTYFDCYCIPYTTSGGSARYISNFSTTGGITDINNASGNSASGYSDFAATVSGSAYQGATIDYSITVAGGNSGRAIYLDYNMDGVFQANEKVASSTTTAVSPLTGSFTIPLDATPGTMRMRVVAGSSLVNPNSPCSISSTGEYEDYQFTIEQLPACTGVPAATISSSVTELCSGDTILLTASPSHLEMTGLSFQFQSSTNGTDWTNLGGLSTTSNTYTVSGQGATTQYRVLVACGSNEGTAAPVTVDQTPFMQCHCTPAITGSGGGNTRYISNFTTTGGITDISNPSGGSATGYTDFSGTHSGSAYMGATINYSITTASSSTHGRSIWIDYNRDGDFNDPGERVASSTSTAASPLTGSFTIPLTGITPGVTRMRVLAHSTANPNNPCTLTGNGEYEDYTFEIVAIPECAGPPPAFISSSVAEVCTGSAFTLTATPTHLELAGLTYQFQSSTDGTNWTDIGTAGATNTYVVSSQSVTTYYRVRAICSTGGSTESDPVMVTQKSFMDCYCVPYTNSGGTARYISNFTTTGGITDINNTSLGSNTGYTDFAATVSGSAYEGATISYSIATASTSNHGHAVYLDYDMDGVFQSSERVANSTSTAASPISGSFTIPLGATPGTMRLRVVASSQANPNNPCNLSGNGEYEDYTFTIVTLPSCTGEPAAVVASSVSNACAGTPFTLTATPTPYELNGLTYQFQASDNGADWNNLGSVSANHTYTVASQTTTTQYRVLLTCSGGSTGTSAAITVNQNTFMDCYCTPSTSSGGATRYISNFSTSGGITDINNASGNSTTGYTDFTATISGSAYQGATINYSITTVGGNASRSIWIDYNRDGDFDDLGERVVSITGTVASPISGSFTIPMNVTPGITRMRVVTFSSTNPNNSCTLSGSGEYEDYIFEIVAIPECSGAPAATIGSNVSSVCTGAPITLTAGPTPLQLAGLTYQFQFSTDGVNWNDMGAIGTANTYTVASQSVTTQYRVLANCAGSVGTAVPVTVAQKAPTDCYCTPTYSIGCYDDYINSFNLAGENGTSINQPATGCTGGYANYSALSVDMYPGSTYAGNFSLFVDPLYPYEYIRIWVDYNNDGVFESSEIIGNGGPWGPTNVSFNVAVPLGTQPGPKRMRVRAAYDATNMDPCIQYAYGETHDYTINILPLPPCSGTPAATISSNMTSACSTSTFTLSAGPVGASGYSYQFQVSTNGGSDWANLGVVSPNHTYTVNAQSATSLYRVIVACASPGGGSHTSASIEVTQKPCYCTPTFIYGCSMDYINGFRLDGEGGSQILQNATGCNGSGYADYSSLSVNWLPGNTYLGRFTIYTDYTSSIYVGIWIDYNDNGVFETSELIDTGGPFGTDLIDFDVAVPSWVTPGPKRMRIGIAYGAVPTDACGTYGYGEMHDYTVNILGCTGTPAAGTIATAAPFNYCGTVPAKVLSLAGYMPTPGVSLQWQSSADGITFTDISGATATNYTTAASNVTTHYRVKTSCATSGESSFSNLITLTVTAEGSWTGAVSADWNDAVNWCGGIPAATSDVLIPGSALNQPAILIGYTGTARHITLDGGTLTVNGTLNLHGDLSYVSGGSMDATAGTLNLAGTGLQILPSAPLVLRDVAITGPGHKTLTNDLTITGGLHFENGLLVLQDAILTLQSPAAITFNNDASYILTDGDNSGLRQQVISTGTAFIVGKSTQQQAVLLNNANDQYYTVRVSDGVLEGGATGTPVNPAQTFVVDRTWHITPDDPANADVDLALYWLEDQVNSMDFDPSRVYIAHHNGTEWENLSGLPAEDASPAAEVGGWYIALQENVTAFSPFTVGSGAAPFPLPVALTGISARNEGSSNRIEWQSGKEANVSHYEIEKSRDGKSFNYLSKTEAMNQPFGYITYDDAPFEGLTYYRLKMIDKDGSFAYSKVVSAFMKGKHGFAMSAFPNPATSSVTVKVEGGTKGAQLQLTDLSGRVIARQEVVGGEAQFDVRSLASGVYFIKYADGQRTEAIKVNKQ